MSLEDPTPKEVEVSFADIFSELGTSDTTVEFPFCFIYGKNIRRDFFKISAPSPELAALTASQLAQKANDIAVSLGFAPLWRAIAGDCS